MKTDLGSSVAGESAFIPLLMRTVGVKGPIVSECRVVGGGGGVGGSGSMCGCACS